MTRPRRAEAPADALAEIACACATARQVARLLTQLYDSRLRAAGLEAPQFALLMALDQHGPRNQGTLGRRHALDKTTVSRNLRWLQRKRWIAAARGGDRRERQFTLTAAGRTQLAAALPAWKKAQAELRAGMSAKEWDAMFRAFRTVARAALAAR
jgi:DNA-binding MarR family transcriptional regulator